MQRFLKVYNFVGRWGIVILLGLLIFFGILNRLYIVVQYKEFDYIIEALLILLALFLVYRIYKKGIIRIENLKVYRILLFIGIVLRIIIAIHDFYNRPVQNSDYIKHEELGYRLAFEGEFYDFAGVELRNFRQPGLPAIFAAGLIIYNHPAVYSIVMILFSFGVLISGFYLFRDIKNIAGCLSYAYICFSPNMIFMASNSNTQLSFFFFIILLFVVLKNYEGKTYQLIIIGAIFAAEMYIRFNFLMLILLIPFMMEIHKKKNISYTFIKLGLIYLSFLVLYSPWIFRNYSVYGKIRLMPTTGMGLYSSNVTKDYRRAGGYNGVPDSLLTKYKDLSEIEFDNALKNETLEFVKNNTDIYVKGIPFRLMKYASRQDWTIGYFFQFTKYPGAELLEKFFQAIENFLIWMIIFYPLIYLIKNKSISSLSMYILWAYLIYSLVLLPISESRSRYNFPYILFPMIAVALDRKRSDNSFSTTS